MNVGLLLYFQWLHLVNINAFNWAQAILSINISGTLHKQCFRGKKVTFFILPSLCCSHTVVLPYSWQTAFRLWSEFLNTASHTLKHTHSQSHAQTDLTHTHKHSRTYSRTHTHTHKQAHISCLCVHFLNFAYNFPQCNHAQPLNSKFVGSSLFSQIKLQNIKLSPRPQREFDVFQWTALCFA